MSEGTCPDCGLPRRNSSHAFSEGTCSAHRNVNGKAACGIRTLTILRCQLSAATARASELERELALADEELAGLRSRLAARESDLDESRQDASAAIDRAKKAEAEALDTLDLLGRGIQLMEGEDELRALVAQRDTELVAMQEQVALYRKGYEARGKILAAYRTGGRPSEKAMIDASDVASRLALIAPEGKEE